MNNEGGPAKHGTPVLLNNTARAVLVVFGMHMLARIGLSLTIGGLSRSRDHVTLTELGVRRFEKTIATLR